MVLAAVLALSAACTWEGDPAVPIVSEIGDRDSLDCSSVDTLVDSILMSVPEGSNASGYTTLAGVESGCAEEYQAMCDALGEASDPRIRSACGE